MRNFKIEEAVWLGAEIDNKTQFTHWTNGEVANYFNIKPSIKFDQEGVTCLNAAYTKLIKIGGTTTFVAIKAITWRVKENRILQQSRVDETR